MGGTTKQKKDTLNLTAKLKAQAAAEDVPARCLIQALSALDKDGYVKAIVETPKDSRNKYDYDPESGMFECSSALQAGMTFPFDFGFIPSTRAQDGDPLDVIILMDEPSFAGCLVHCRIIGVLEAEQSEDGKTFRNDRLIGVHIKSVDYGSYDNWKQLQPSIRDQMEAFFIHYNSCKGKQFRPIGWRGPKQAYKLLQQCLLKKTLKKVLKKSA